MNAAFACRRILADEILDAGPAREAQLLEIEARAFRGEGDEIDWADGWNPQRLTEAVKAL